MAKGQSYHTHILEMEGIPCSTYPHCLGAFGLTVARLWNTLRPAERPITRHINVAVHTLVANIWTAYEDLNQPVRL